MDVELHAALFSCGVLHSVPTCMYTADVFALCSAQTTPLLRGFRGKFTSDSCCVPVLLLIAVAANGNMEPGRIGITHFISEQTYLIL